MHFMPIAFRRLFSTTVSLKNAKPSIGFIGLGQMGIPMSTNLFQKAKGQFDQFVVYDVMESAMQAFQQQNQGGLMSKSLSDMGRCQVIVTMLPTPQHVEQVYLDRTHGLINVVRPGTLLIDSSTIDPETSQRVAKTIQEKTKAFSIDAPVSGGTVGAKAGTLTFMVGGSEEAFDKAKPWLQCMGRSLVYCGGHGNGQIAKLCNNMLLGATMFATSEALNLGAQLGLDPRLLTSILNTSTGRSWSSEMYSPVPGILPNVPSSNHYEGGFSLSLMQKDMGLAIASAQKVKASVPLSAVADQLYKHLMTLPGLEKKDFSISYAWLSKKFTQYLSNKK